MSWTTEFKHTSRGDRLLIFKFEGFAEVHYTKNETHVYKNGKKIMSFDGDINGDELQLLLDRVNQAREKIKEFHHDDN